MDTDEHRWEKDKQAGEYPDPPGFSIYKLLSFGDVLARMPYAEKLTVMFSEEVENALSEDVIY